MIFHSAVCTAVFFGKKRLKRRRSVRYNQRKKERTMETTEKRQEAIERKHAGYNCCQAVLCAFADKTPYT
jgi:hypothetical protein